MNETMDAEAFEEAEQQSQEENELRSWESDTIFVASPGFDWRRFIPADLKRSA